MKSRNKDTNGKEASRAEETSEFASSSSNTGAIEESAMESANNTGDSGSKVPQKGNVVYQGPDQDNALLMLSGREFSDEKTCDANGVSDKQAKKVLHQTCDDNGASDEKAHKLANSDSCGTKEEGIAFNEQPATNSVIVGDITHEGLLTLGLPKDICSKPCRNIHCFSMAEIHHVLSLPGPHKLQIAGIESLDLAPKVQEMVKFKKENSEGWLFPDEENLVQLSEINELLGGLRADLKKIRKRWWRSEGNNAAASSALKASCRIRKKADSLSSKIQQNIAVKLCKLMAKDPPHSVFDNLEELSLMAKAEKKKPVWFLKGGSSRRKTRNVR